MVTQTPKTGSSRQRKASWIFSGLFGILALLVIFSSATSGILMLIFAFIISPRGTRAMEKIAPNFRKGRKKWVSYIGSFIIILIIFMASGPSINGIPGKYLGTIYPDQGTHDKQQVKDFSATFAQLILAYQDADLTERMSLEFSPLDFTGDGYVQIMGMVSAKWKEVIEWNDKLAEFAKYASDEISYINIPRYAYSPFTVYAIGAEDAVNRSLKTDTSEGYKTYQAEQTSDAAKEAKKKIMDQIDLIKTAYPNKKWFEIINARMGLAGKLGIQRMEERSTDDVKDAAEVVAYNNKWEARYNAGQTAIKIVLYTAAAPEAIAAGGAGTAVTIFLGGVDVGVGVGDTIDIVVNGDNENTLWKAIKSGAKTGTDAYGNIMLIKDVTSLIKNPSKWTTDELMTVLNLAAGEVDPEEALILNVSEDGEMTINYTDELPEELGFGKGQTLSDFETAPIRGEFESIDRYMMRVEAWKGMKEYLERPSTKMEIARLKTLRETKLKAEADEQARKQAEYDKINTAAAKARQQKAAQQQLQAQAAEDAELKAALDKLNIDTTPAPAPVVPTTPSVAPGTITTCGACASAGLDCACGSAACRCCSPGDSNCNAYDL